MNARSVLLFEFKFHQEIIPSQIRFLLAGGFDVHLFLNRDLWDETLFSCVKDQIKVTLVNRPDKILTKVRLFFQMTRYVDEHRITNLVVNTLDSTFGGFIIRRLSRLHKVGVVHRVHEIASNRSFANNVRRMDGVLTLSAKTHEYLRKNFPWAADSAWFYPIFFCGAELSSQSSFHGISIVIPGQISYERRDYKSLLKIAAALKQDHVNVKFKLLGNARKFDGPAFKDEIAATGLQDFFTIWDAFVPYKTFLDEIASADYVMPLLTPDQGNSRNYEASQISAALNWALGFRKKLLLHRHFSQLDFISGNSVLYDNEGLMELFHNLQKPGPDDYQDVPELSFENISRNYLQVFQNK